MTITKAGLTEGNRWRGAQSHELRRQNPASCNSDGILPSTKGGVWKSMKAVREIPVESIPEGTVQDPNKIYKTQRIQVTTESLRSPGISTLSPKSMSPSGVVPFGHQKTASLMGTTYVYGPGQAVRSTKSDITRSQSLTESEQEIIRDSSDGQYSSKR